MWLLLLLLRHPADLNIHWPTPERNHQKLDIHSAHLEKNCLKRLEREDGRDVFGMIIVIKTQCTHYLFLYLKDNQWHVRETIKLMLCEIVKC